MNNINNNKVAVIIEPRRHPLLFKIIKNVMFNLGSEWNLHVFCNDPNYIYSNLKNVTFSLNTIDKDNLTEEQYNTLLLSKEFWNTIKEENILIFQTDSFILNKRQEDLYINENFIGGVYFYGQFNKINCHMANSPKLHYSINGGFSFRKKNIMLECLDKVTISNIIQYRNKYKMNNNLFLKTVIPEDLYFQNAIELLNYKLPSIDKCNEFCENLSYESINLNAFGIHHIDSNLINYLNNDKLLKIHINLKLNCGSLLDEIPEQLMVINYLKSDDKVLEIGSNIGRNTLVISSILNDSMNLVTLESDYNICKQLIENKNINNFKFNIENSALSKKN